MEEVHVERLGEVLKHELYVSQATARMQSTLISKLRSIVLSGAACSFTGASTYRVNVDTARYFTITHISGPNYTLILKEYNKPEDKFTVAGEEVESLYQLVAKRVMEAKAEIATERLEERIAIVDGWLK